MVGASNPRNTVSTPSKGKKNAHDVWMRIIRDVETHTEDPGDFAENTVKINGILYHVAHVGSTIVVEEYKKMLSASKKDPPFTVNGDRVTLSQAYRTIKKEYADNEFATKYDEKLFVTYVNVSNSPKNQDQTRAPLNFVDRIYDMQTKTALGMHKGKGTAKWSEFDNFPKGATHPIFCVRYYHNQVRPRSGICTKRAADDTNESVGKKQRIDLGGSAHASVDDNAAPNKRGLVSIISLYHGHVGGYTKALSDSALGDDLRVPAGLFNEPAKGGHSVVCTDELPEDVRWVVAPTPHDLDANFVTPEPVAVEAVPSNNETVEEATKVYIESRVRDAIELATEGMIQRITSSMREMCDGHMQNWRKAFKGAEEESAIARAINGIRKDMRCMFPKAVNSNAHKKPKARKQERCV
ncbi:hypothetical protein CYMTET_3871 [Cymbomonas tetramitiformis]|uniref:Uncharacterized protein n=1 Tax=Cymbomonas tetramitiformis TaxID=36881 RepID=A0AAE0H2C7_9CHLO|nr:hypothetical protein CYMTET_3871 [Cymbomonas tetramitiformis]|eukprot:gene31552-39700_t